MADWKLGDLALCIRERMFRDEDGTVDGNGPERGSVHRVQDIAICESPSWAGMVGLRFDGWEYYYNQRGFRKIRQDEHEACEEEFVTLLKLSKERVAA